MTWFEAFALLWPFVSVAFVVAGAVLLNLYGERLEHRWQRHHPAE